MQIVYRVRSISLATGSVLDDYCPRSVRGLLWWGKAARRAHGRCARVERSITYVAARS